MSTFAKRNINNATSTPPPRLTVIMNFVTAPYYIWKTNFKSTVVAEGGVALDLLNTCAQQNLNDTASLPLRVDNKGPFLIIWKKKDYQFYNLFPQIFKFHK